MIETRMEGMTGYNSTGEVRFQGRAKYGRGGTVVGMTVPKATIIALAEAFKHTDSPGHAVWHVNNPDHQMPCETCVAAEARLEKTA